MFLSLPDDGQVDWPKHVVPSVISGFRRDIDDICALLGSYAASCGNPLPTFRDIFKGQDTQEEKDFLTLDDGTDTLSRNVGKGLQFDAA
jgi:hypothetical protein